MLTCGADCGRQNEMVRLRAGGDFLLSLCLLVLRGQSWRRLWGRQGRGDGETKRGSQELGSGLEQNICKWPERGDRLRFSGDCRDTSCDTVVCDCRHSSPDREMSAFASVSSSV